MKAAGFVVELAVDSVLEDAFVVDELAEALAQISRSSREADCLATPKACSMHSKATVRLSLAGSVRFELVSIWCVRKASIFLTVSRVFSPDILSLSMGLYLISERGRESSVCSGMEKLASYNFSLAHV